MVEEEQPEGLSARKLVVELQNTTSSRPTTPAMAWIFSTDFQM
jgi:hypothetical protein